MSDDFVSIVPDTIELERPVATARTVVEWLAAKEIIVEQLTNCVLGSPSGFPPGRRYQDALDRNLNYGDFEKLLTNGVQVTTGRTIFDAGGNGLTAVICPGCQANIIGSGWADFLTEWVHGGTSCLQCPECRQKSPLNAYDFNIEQKLIWALSNFGLTFWNWPGDFKTSFVAELEGVIGSPVKIVFGRL